MKVVGLQVENVKKLKAITIIPEGNVVKISGPNEQGKTTVLDSIWYALCGTKNICEQPIRNGQKKANVTVNLGDMIVTRKFTERGSTLEVTNAKGLKFSSPQAMLDKLIGKFSFDPLAFSKADKKVQVDTLLGIVSISIDIDKLAEISGVVVKEGVNPLATLNNVYKDAFDTRTGVNRERDKAKATFESKSGAVETSAVSISELVAEKERLTEINLNNEKQRKLKGEKDSNIRQHERDIAQVNSIIEKLKNQLAEQEGILITLTEELENSRVLLEPFSAEVEALEDVDLTDINERIASADETNQKARDWEEYLTAKDSYETLKEESKVCTSQIDAVLNYKAELMKATKFPIEGLDFMAGGVIYQGLPFEQASSAQKLQVSLAIAMALNPELRVIRIDDGSLLDKAHMAVIERMAAENDFQIWMEVVDETGTVGIYIEDGEVK